MKRALITGITGQDGSYLAELLLSKGYKVYGMIRRSSTVPFERIQHLRDKIELIHGDLLDPTSLYHCIAESEPDEIYNLAAQSFVPTSWTEPVLTAEFTAVGVTRMLEAIRQVNRNIRFYQASSSEMFGKVQQVPQNELTSFYPRSPYGVAKVYGHWITVNYRESYGLYACSGILFNHECVTGDTPVIIRRHGMIDILPMEEAVPHPENHKDSKRSQFKPVEEIEVWDRNHFTKVKLMSARWSEPGANDAKVVVQITAPSAFVRVTKEHLSFVEDESGVPAAMPSGELAAGQKLALCKIAPSPSFVPVTEDEAWLLGVLTIKGEITNGKDLRVVSEHASLLDLVEKIWPKLTTGTIQRRDVTNTLGAVSLTGAPHFAQKLAHELISHKNHRHVPKRILNAEPAARLAYLRGCRDADSGPGSTKFEEFTMDAATLAAGIWWLCQVTIDEKPRLKHINSQGHDEFRIVFSEPSTPTPPGQILRIVLTEHKGWLFDFETESGTFHAGIGDAWVHNSPRRGLEFVTRKVTDGVARIVNGKATQLALGNLTAKRDWGFAGDYVEAMWLMLQQSEPDDYVISSGETHSIEELCEIAFGHAGLDWRKHVVLDPKFLRPAEVDLLIGDATKAKEKLGWEPKVSFTELIKMMVEADLKRTRLGAPPTY